MENITQHAKKIWNLAINNKKVTGVIVAVVIILIILQ
jgi:hypothetical protein